MIPIYQVLKYRKNVIYYLDIYMHERSINTGNGKYQHQDTFHLFS